ncbi:MAG: flotillin family protein [Planctomycetes bacterium]|nr:flotillin family protein [Planctomycetota bacterium]
MDFLWLVLAFVFVVFVTVIVLLQRYKRCPPDRIMVIFGKVGQDEGGGGLSARCIHGGAAFIFPVIQDYQFLDLTPLTMDIDLQGALSQQNIRISAPSTFTVGISTESGVMENAAERLLGIPSPEVRSIAEDIIFGQTRVVIATMKIEEIIANRDIFVENIMNGVEVELKKIGLKLINVNIKDITDESGYIEALGKEAAARAINEAKKAVAEKHRDGEIGKAEAEREQRIRTSAANAAAVDGENTARINIANSDANRRENEAEAERKGTAAEKVQTARALEESYQAEQKAEMQRSERVRATQTANVVVPSEIEKQKVQIDADALAERYRREAAGEADAIYLKLEAQARGNREILVKQAEGLASIVSAAGDSAQLAALLMITDKLPELVATQVEAVKNLKIDKVTVWDSAGGGKDGKTSTARFLSGLMGSLPPLENLFDMAGMSLPSVLDVSGRAKGGPAAAQDHLPTLDPAAPDESGTRQPDEA